MRQKPVEAIHFQDHYDDDDEEEDQGDDDDQDDGHCDKIWWLIILRVSVKLENLFQQYARCFIQFGDFFAAQILCKFEQISKVWKRV